MYLLEICNSTGVSLKNRSLPLLTSVTALASRYLSWHKLWELQNYLNKVSNTKDLLPQSKGIHLVFFHTFTHNIRKEAFALLYNQNCWGQERSSSQKLKGKKPNQTKNHPPHSVKKKCHNNLKSLVVKHALPSLPNHKIMFKLLITTP